MTFLIVQITHKDIEKVNSIISSLSKNNLFLDCNIVSSQNISFVNNVIKTTPEIIINLKIKMMDWLKVVNQVEGLYPNEIMSIVRFEVSANEKYEKIFYNNSY